jgi:segregation and condensation protein A
VQQAQATNNYNDSEFLVNLEFFSGPMDLLLHLVEQQEVEIENVDLSEVCDQYLKIVERSAELDLERAGEYLVVAATLVARKSEALLPRGNPEDIVLEEEGYDPRFFTELRERLIAYKETKSRAELLISHPQLGIEEFITKRVFVDPESKDTEHEEIQGEPLELGKFFFGLLKRIGEAGKVFKVKLESITVIKYMVSLLDRLTDLAAIDSKSKRGFLDLVSDCPDTASVKGRLTGNFIATLELIKRGVVSVTGDSGNFTLEVKNTDQNVLLSPSEFDAAEEQQQEAGQVSNDSKIIEISMFQVAQEEEPNEYLEKRANQ